MNLKTQHLQSSEPPLVSIAIPTYNRLGLLKETLKSAQNQDYSNLEIVILDNHSEDGTFEYIKECAVQDSRIKIIRRKKNIGPIENPRQIPDYIHGKYLLVLSDDDLIETHICNKAVELMEKDSSIALYVAKVDYFFGSSEYSVARKTVSKSKQMHAECISGHDFLKKRLGRMLEMAWCGCVYRTERIQKMGGFHPLLSLDLQSMSLVSYDQNVFIDNAVLGHYRIHSKNNSQSCWKDPQIIYDDLKECFMSIKHFYPEASSFDIDFCKYIIYWMLADATMINLKNRFNLLFKLSDSFNVPKIQLRLYCYFSLIRSIFLKTRGFGGQIYRKLTNGL